ncbi:MAG TPA: hypothetical protein VGI03_06180 [Verrucomicrobiae bacterium]|jgi:hypothetical protein
MKNETGTNGGPWQLATENCQTNPKQKNQMTAILKGILNIFQPTILKANPFFNCGLIAASKQSEDGWTVPRRRFWKGVARSNAKLRLGIRKFWTVDRSALKNLRFSVKSADLFR